MKPLPRRALLGAVALAAVALAALAKVGSAPEAEEAPPAPSHNTGALTQPAAALQLGSAFQAHPLPHAEDAFAVRDWDPRPPAPPAKRPAAPAKPTVPPLPFTFLGRLVDRGKATVFLERGGDIVVAQTDQAIDADYRLDSVGPDQIVFTYLPLKARQVLPIRPDQ